MSAALRPRTDEPPVPGPVGSEARSSLIVQRRDLPSYDAIVEVDVLSRPDGRFMLGMIGAPVPREIYLDACLFLKYDERAATVFFKHYVDGWNDEEIVVIASVPCPSMPIMSIIRAHGWIDVLVFNALKEPEDLQVDDVQNFLAFVDV